MRQDSSRPFSGEMETQGIDHISARNAGYASRIMGKGVNRTVRKENEFGAVILWGGSWIPNGLHAAIKKLTASPGSAG